MSGKITTADYTSKTYTAGADLQFGELVHIDGDAVKPFTDATKPIEGVVAKTEHDMKDKISKGDTVTVLQSGEIEMKKKTGEDLTAKTFYSNKEVSGDTSNGAVQLVGLSAVEKVDDNTAIVRVNGAISII